MESIIETFNLRNPVHHYGLEDHLDFYLGLTDFDKEDVWTWSTSGRILNMTIHKRKWGKDEPNGHDCAYIAINSKYFDKYRSDFFHDKKIPKIRDTNCEEKLTIVCMRKIFV